MPIRLRSGLALLLLLLLPGSALAQEAGVAVSTPTRNPVFEAVERVTTETLRQAGALTEGAVDLTKRMRRFAIELGAGEDADLRSVTDPFMPKGLERLFEWDLRLVIRSEGLALRADYLNPPGLRRLSMHYRMRFDPFDRAGLGVQRDNLYDSLGLTLPIEKRGYGISMSAVRDAHWGYTASYDRVRTSAGPTVSRDQVTVFGIGYSPLGENPGKAWNWTMVGAVNWEDLHTNVAGVPSTSHGPGFSIGPAYQLGLDWIPIARRFKLNRLTLRLAYLDSQIHPSAFSLGSDVTAYLTKSLRLTAGVVQSWQPRQGDRQLSLRFAVALLLNFRNFRF